MRNYFPWFATLAAAGGKTSHQLTKIAIFRESDNRGRGKIIFHLDISISRCDIGSSPTPPRGGLQLVLHSFASCRRRRTASPYKKMRSESEPHRPRGGGGSRTRVQTRSPKAFYTFILRLILLRGMAADDLTLCRSLLNLIRQPRRMPHYP